MSTAVRIRLSRHGMRNAPLYHIVAIPAGKAREGRPLEKLGEYDPIPKTRNTSFIPESNRVFGSAKHVEQPKEKNVQWDIGRIKWWLSQGAEPTGSVVKLLSRAGIINASSYTKKVARTIRTEAAAQTTSPANVRIAKNKQAKEAGDDAFLQAEFAKAEQRMKKQKEAEA